MRVVAIVGLAVGVIALVVVLMEIQVQRDFRKEVRSNLKEVAPEEETEWYDNLTTTR